MFTRPVRKTLVLNTICTVCITQTVYYISLLCVKYGMYAYAGRAYICRMYAPSMLFPPTQGLGPTTLRDDDVDLCWDDSDDGDVWENSIARARRRRRMRGRMCARASLDLSWRMRSFSSRLALLSEYRGTAYCVSFVPIYRYTHIHT